MKRVLFVCTGNICRSPMAEAVLRKMAADAGMSVGIDSAGTGSWHQGEKADARARRTAAARGYNGDDITARALRTTDFDEFDIIYAMAKSHLHIMRRLSPRSADKIKLFLGDTVGEDVDVPDPYYGGNEGFEHMLDLLERGCAAIVKKHGGE